MSVKTFQPNKKIFSKVRNGIRRIAAEQVQIDILPYNCKS